MLRIVSENFETCDIIERCLIVFLGIRKICCTSVTQWLENSTLQSNIQVRVMTVTMWMFHLLLGWLFVLTRYSTSYLSDCWVTIIYQLHVYWDWGIGASGGRTLPFCYQNIRKIQHWRWMYRTLRNKIPLTPFCFPTLAILCTDSTILGHSI